MRSLHEFLLRIGLVRQISQVYDPIPMGWGVAYVLPEYFCYFIMPAPLNHVASNLMAAWHDALPWIRGHGTHAGWVLEEIDKAGREGYILGFATGQRHALQESLDRS